MSVYSMINLIKEMMCFLILFTLLIFSQQNYKVKQACSIKIDNFDVATWKTDSLGCQRKRLSLYMNVINNKKKIINHSRADVECLLGVANSVSSTRRSEFYYLESGIQCTPLKKR